MTDVIQQVLTGLTLGCVYGLIALGYTLIFGVGRVIFFAQGDLSMLAAFAAVLSLKVLGSGHSTVTRVLMAILAAVVVTAAAALLAERFTVRPVIHAPRTKQLVASLGVSLILQNGVMLLVSAENLPFPQLIANKSFPFFSARITSVQCFIILAAISTVIGQHALLRWTRLGLRIRAVAASRETAALDGIFLGRTVAVVFVIGSLAAAVAGILTASYDGVVKYNMGFLPGIKGFTAAILGGFGSPAGAIVGGLVLGMSESLTAGYVSSTYKDVVAFAILVAILIFRPKGLVGAE